MDAVVAGNLIGGAVPVVLLFAEGLDRAVEKELLMSSGGCECHDSVAGARMVLTLGLGILRWNNS